MQSDKGNTEDISRDVGEVGGRGCTRCRRYYRRYWNESLRFFGSSGLTNAGDIEETAWSQVRDSEEIDIKNDNEEGAVFCTYCLCMWKRMLREEDGDLADKT